MIDTAIFPVAGHGTRFFPATKSIPKEMLPVYNKPLIQFAVEEALAVGIKRIIFITGQGKYAIENYFDELCNTMDLTDYCLLETGCISYIHQPKPLGLGHAVWCARKYVNDGPFCVILVDDLLLGTNTLSAMLDTQNADNTSNVLLLKPISTSSADCYGIASINGGLVTKVVEKPKVYVKNPLAIVGRYVLQPQVFEYLEKCQPGANSEIQLTDAISKMIEDGHEFRFTNLLDEHFDCGSPRGLLDATLKRATMLDC